jgi:hypothetical protein
VTWNQTLKSATVDNIFLCIGSHTSSVSHVLFAERQKAFISGTVSDEASADLTVIVTSICKLQMHINHSLLLQLYRTRSDI